MTSYQILLVLERNSGKESKTTNYNTQYVQQLFNDSLVKAQRNWKTVTANLFNLQLFNQV